MSLNSSQRRIRKSGSKRKGLEVYSLKYQGTITAIDKNDTNFYLYLGDLYWVNPGSLQVSSGTGLCTAVKGREGEVRKGRKRRNRAEGADLWARSSNLLWLCIIFCKVKLTEMEAILHGTVAMANEWESPASSATPNDSSHLLFYCHSWSQFTLLGAELCPWAPSSLLASLLWWTFYGQHPWRPHWGLCTQTGFRECCQSHEVLTHCHWLLMAGSFQKPMDCTFDTTEPTTGKNAMKFH